MGYMIKSEVMQTIEEDMKETLMCYQGDRNTREIVRFCYESVLREIDKLPQYRLENVTKIN